MRYRSAQAGTDSGLLRDRSAWLELRINARVMEIAVWARDPTVPTARPADPGRIGEHGPEIVKAVTEELFTEQEPAGKRITARIALSEAKGRPVNDLQVLLA
ncbi:MULTISPECIES: hypothetical protein [unclassified Streptomyces]|uniref:hypothetical protein n=1 Tax=unclassified Streptomyces TaxID=2593676 RepID=UPI0015CEF744|nr:MULTISPECIES: hypothetical protein [unclassified Streptomyces]